MAAQANPVLQSGAILLTSTKGKGQFFSPEQLYRELGVTARNPPLTVDEFRAFLEDMAHRDLLRRWEVDPTAGKGEVVAGT